MPLGHSYGFAGVSDGTDGTNGEVRMCEVGVMEQTRANIADSIIITTKNH